MVWTPEAALEFGREHVMVWNRHDLKEIARLYAPDVELVSPLAGEITDSSTLKGREAAVRYFGAALDRHPDLRFELADVLYCIDTVTLYFRSIGGRMVAEVLTVNPGEPISRVQAHYTCSPPTARDV